MVGWGLVGVGFPLLGWPSGAGGGMAHILAGFPDLDQAPVCLCWFIYLFLGPPFPLAFPSSPPCPACSTCVTTWVLIKHNTGDTISEDRHYEFPDWPSASFLQLTFSLSHMPSDRPLWGSVLVNFIPSNCCPMLQSGYHMPIWLVHSAAMARLSATSMLHSSLFWTFPCMSLHGTAWDWLQVWTWEQECWVKVIRLLTSTKYHQLRCFQKAGTRPHFAHRLLYHLTNYPAL